MGKKGVGCINARNRGDANMRWMGKTHRQHREVSEDWAYTMNRYGT